MIRIGICDDEKILLGHTSEFCKEILEKEKVDYEIFEFHNGKEVMAFQDELDILISDIDMPEMNGIELAERLGNQGRDTIIIFLTSYVDYMPYAYNTNVKGYVDRFRMNEILPKKIFAAIDEIKRVVFINGMYQSNKVHYIKAKREYCELFFGEKKDSVLLRVPFSYLEKELENADFLCVHKSYLVNLNWVDRIIDRKVHIDDQVISVARRRWPKVEGGWLKYVFR